MEFVIGILCGIALSMLFSFGPAFFGLIQNSIQYGFRRAMLFVLGVSLSDAIVVALMLTVLKNIDMAAVMHNVYVAVIGGVGIIFIGVHTWRKRAVAQADKHNKPFATDTDSHRWQIFSHGFLLNFLNPFIWIYWISVITVVSAEAGLGGTDLYVFFAGLLVAALGCDLLKCRLAAFLQMWFTSKRLAIFNKATAVVLVAFGVYMIASMVVYQTNPTAREKEQQSSPQPTRLIQSIHSHIAKDTARPCTDTTYFK